MDTPSSSWMARWMVLRGPPESRGSWRGRTLQSNAQPKPLFASGILGNRSKKYWKSKKNPETRGFPRHVWDLKILCHYVAQVKSPSFRPEACYARVSGHPEIAASPGDMLPKNIDLHEDPWKKSGFGWQKNSQKNRQRNKGKSYFNIIIRHMNFHIPHQQLPSHLY